MPVGPPRRHDQVAGAEAERLQHLRNISLVLIEVPVGEVRETYIGVGGEHGQCRKQLSAPQHRQLTRGDRRRSRVRRVSIRRYHHDDRDAAPRRTRDQSGRPEGLVVGMRRHHHESPRVAEVESGHPRPAFTRQPLVFGGAGMRSVERHHGRVSLPRIMRPRCASSRSAWCCLTYIARSACRRTNDASSAKAPGPRL